MELPIPTRAASGAIAERLLREHAARTPFRPFAKAEGVTTVAAAYQVQREYVQRLLATTQSERAGYKIGLTSAAMQSMCGIDSPVAGVVLAGRIHASGTRLRLADYARFGVEFEIAVRISRAMPAVDRPYELTDIEQAIDGVAPAMEIVDDRACDYRTLDVLSLIADNAWNAGIVVGEFRPTWPDLAQVEGTVVVGTAEVVGRGRGSDVLAHPLLPVAWLANHLRSEGRALVPGEIVMTGSMVTTKFPTTPQHYRFEVTGLGAVELDVTE